MKKSKAKMSVILIATLLMTLTALASCSGLDMGGSNQDISEITIPETAAIGLIETEMNVKHSTIIWLDEKLAEVGSSKIPYSYLSQTVGFQNACYDREQAVLVSSATDKADGRVIWLNRTDGTVVTQPQKRSNYTAYNAGDGKVAVVSNLNWEFFVDITTKEDGEFRSFKMPEGVEADSAVIAGDKIFVSALNEAERTELSELDYESGELRKLVELSDEVTFFPYDGDKTIYYVNDGELVAYNTESAEEKRSKLGRKAEFYNLWLDKDSRQLWIGYTDIHSEEESYIEKMDLDTMKVISSGTYPGSIWQMDASGDTLYVLGLDSMSVYVAKDGKLEETAKAELEGQLFIRM